MKLFSLWVAFLVMTSVASEPFEDKDLREYSGLKFAPVSGLVLKRSEFGEIAEKSHYLRGIKNGISKAFHPNGNVSAVGGFVNDLREGSWSWFRPDGSLQRMGQYINGRWNGDWEWFDEQGRPTLKKSYVNGSEVSD